MANLTTYARDALPIVDNLYNESLLQGGLILNRLLTPRRHGVLTHLHSATSTVPSGSVAARRERVYEVEVPGAELGDTVTIHLDPALPRELVADAVVTPITAGTGELVAGVQLRIHNPTSRPVDLGLVREVRLDTWRVASLDARLTIRDHLGRGR